MYRNLNNSVHNLLSMQKMCRHLKFLKPNSARYGSIRMIEFCAPVSEIQNGWRVCYNLSSPVPSNLHDFGFITTVVCNPIALTVSTDFPLLERYWRLISLWCTNIVGNETIAKMAAKIWRFTVCLKVWRHNYLPANI